MDNRTLHHIYQAWKQGNDTYDLDCHLFAAFAARHLHASEAQILEILKYCRWFKT
jgi:hypothetical protein